MSCPARGMGVEIQVHWLCVWHPASCPARGMGVEMTVTLIYTISITLSCPARGMGVEIFLYPSYRSP